MPIDPEAITFENILGHEDTILDENDPDDEGPLEGLDEDKQLEEEANNTKEEDNKEELEETDEDVVDEDEEDTDDESTDEVTDEDEDEDDEEVEVSVVDEILATIGFEGEVEKEYDDTVDGLTDFVQDFSKQLANDELKKLPDDIKHFIQYRQTGGDPKEYFETYYNKTDWNEVELQDSSEQQKHIVKEALRKKGYSEDDIKGQIEDFEAADLLHKQAEREIRYLRTKQEEEKENLVKQQEEQRKQQIKQQEEFWNGVSDKIKKENVFNGVPIPKNQKNEFFEYISKPVQDGMSQRDIDAANADIDTKIAIDYLLYSGFNLDEIVERRAKTQKARGLKDRLKKSGKRSLKDKSNRDNKTVRTGDDVDTLDIGDLTDILD